MTTTSDIEALEAELTGAIERADSEATLDSLRVSALGKKGSVSALMKTLSGMTPEERQVMGPALNGLKVRVAQAIATRQTALGDAALEVRLATERLDVTLWCGTSYGTK